MKTKLFILVFALTSTLLFSQSQNMAFEYFKTTDGSQNFFYKNITKTDALGNVYVAGATVNGQGNTDILLAKYNSAGVQLWIKQYAGAGNGTDFAAGLLVTTTDVYVTGAVTTTTANPFTDMITMHYNSAGTLLWATTYNGTGNNFDAGRFPAVDASNNVYVTGASYNASGNSDFVTVKYNASGVQQWVSTYNYSANLDDAGIKIVTSGSNLTVTGAVTSAANSYKYTTLTYAQSNGSLTASNVSTLVTTSSVTAVTDFVTDGTGNMFVVGSTYVAGQGLNYFVQKLTNGLVTLWTYTYNSSSNLDDIARGVGIDASGNVYLTGYSTSSTQGRNITTIQLNSSGVQQWVQTINGTSNGDDEAADMIVDASNNIYITGYKTTTLNKADYYTVKYNSAGTKMWDIVTDGMSLDDNATNIALDSLNNVVVTGQSSIGLNNYQFLTTKYVQFDITNPIDLNNQPSNKNIGFYANKGQLLNNSGVPVPNVLYYTQNQNPEIYLEKNNYDYVFRSVDTIASTVDTLEKIQVNFTGSTSTVTPYGYNPKTYPLNYFLGHLAKPVTTVFGNDRVVTTNLYPNIDLHYYSNSKGLKYYFVVKPGGNVKDIVLTINGALTTTITSNNLFIDGKLGDVTLKKPYAYMVNGSVTTTLTGSSNWSSGGINKYGITVPTYTTTQTLIIVVETVPLASPSGIQANLDYSTYYGGNASDFFTDIKVASNGDRAVVGYSGGGSFPTPNGLYTSPSSSGSFDAVLLKYTADDTLRYATYYGGNGYDQANSVAFNSAGDIFIGGHAQSTDLSIATNNSATNQTSNGYYLNTSLGFKSDGFFTKINSTGNQLLFSRYIGGSKSDYINGIHIDASDNVYVCGTTSSADFPVVNASKNSIGTSPNADQFDNFVGKFDANQSANWLTYFGGSYNSNASTSTTEYASDIVTDNAGNVFVGGVSDELNFPVQNPTPSNPNTFYDNHLDGTSDGYIARFTSSGVPNYATFVGGASDEILRRIVYKPNTGELYFAGKAYSSTGFPFKVKSGAYNSTYRLIGGNSFVGYINSVLEPQWVTYYGKSKTKSFDVGGLSVDNTGVVYMSGTTNSDSLVYGSSVPLGAYADNTLGNTDGYVAIFNSSKQIIHAHYFGGSGSDGIGNSDINGTSSLYVVGNTTSASGSTITANNFPIAYTPITASLIDSTFNGSNDGFISRFNLYAYNLVGVHEMSSITNGNILVYPNPTSNHVTLKVNTDFTEDLHLKVYNTMGQIIHEELFSSNEKIVDCSRWATGVYIFVINNKSMNSSFKIIKD